MVSSCSFGDFFSIFGLARIYHLVCTIYTRNFTYLLWHGVYDYECEFPSFG